MVRFSDDEVLHIFKDLPNHVGCKELELNEIEREFQVQLPEFYRQMMLKYERRLKSAGISPVGHVIENTYSARALLVEDDFKYRLEDNHIVFDWNEYHSFRFFELDSDPDPQIKDFNYYNCHTEPTLHCASLSDYFLTAIRSYLRL